MNFADRLKQRLSEVKESAEEKFIAAPEVIEIRLKTCEECPRLFRTTRQCKECGCFVDAKTRFKNSECPLKKW